MKLIILSCFLIGSIYGDVPPYMVTRDMETMNIDHKFHPMSCKSNLGAVIKQSKCQPRPRLIRLAASSSHEMLHPNMVEVMRCEGTCGFPGYVCMGVSNRTVAIPVSLQQGIKKAPTCGVVHVEEHTACSCGCPIGPGHCSSRQSFDSASCSCQCTNRQEEKTKCEEMGRNWHDFDCTCRCAEEKSCSTGAIFVHEVCKCMKYMEM